MPVHNRTVTYLVEANLEVDPAVIAARATSLQMLRGFVAECKGEESWWWDDNWHKRRHSTCTRTNWNRSPKEQYTKRYRPRRYDDGQGDRANDRWDRAPLWHDSSGSC